MRVSSWGPGFWWVREVGLLYLSRLNFNSPKISFPSSFLPSSLPATPLTGACTQTSPAPTPGLQGGSETHIIIQIKFLLAHHWGAGFGFGKIFETAGALQRELEEAEVLQSVALKGLVE